MKNFEQLRILETMGAQYRMAGGFIRFVEKHTRKEGPHFVALPEAEA